MKRLFIASLVLLTASCGGSLSDEQRQALRKEMENREIKRITEEQIFEKAFVLGQELVNHLNRTNADSIAEVNNVRIFHADSLNRNTSRKEQELTEAYYSSPVADLTDNIQNDGDTLIFSSPIIQGDQLQGIWFVHIPRKKIVSEF